jgi:hypothetical protein
MMAAIDTVTVLRARGRRLAKAIHRDGSVDGYDLARSFDFYEQPVDGLDGLDGLDALLQRLLPRVDLAIVRGAPADAARTRRVRRLIHAQRDGDPPTLVERARHWIPLDFDTADRPPGIDLTNLSACAEVVIATLPVAFRYARCLVAATASHTFKPGLRLRLWYWADRALSGSELKYWLRAVPADPAVYRPAQLIYCAAPIFCDGMVDPLPCRLVQRNGAAQVRVPPADQLRPPKPRSKPPPPAPGMPGSGGYALTALTNAIARISRAGSGQRHPALVAEACRLAPLIHRRLLSEGEVVRGLLAAVRTAGIEGAGRDAQAETEKVLTWALGNRQ